MGGFELAKAETAEALMRLAFTLENRRVHLRWCKFCSFLAGAAFATGLILVVLHLNSKGLLP
jgi:hypothetical protein